MSAYGPAASLGQARDTCQLRCSRVRRLLRKTASCSVDIGDRRASAGWITSAVGDVPAEAGSAFTEVNVVVGARMSCGERLGERRPSACNTCVSSSSCPSSAPVAASAVASAAAGVDAIEKRRATQETRFRKRSREGGNQGTPRTGEGDQVIRENPASRGTETSAEVLVK